MAGSLIVPVRQAVVAGVDALAAFDLVLVTYAWRPDQKRRERAFTAQGRMTHSPASLKAGRTYRDEDARFMFVIEVEGVGLDLSASADRLDVLGAAFEEYIGDTRTTLGVAGVNWLELRGDHEDLELYLDNTAYCRRLYSVRYDARLT